MADKLFDEFYPVNRSQWEEKVTKDLKGKPYEDLLKTVTEGFELAPFYLNGEVGPVFSSSAEDNDWYIREDVLVTRPEATNKVILGALNAGANSLGLRCRDEISEQDFNIILKEVMPEYIRLEIVATDLNPQIGTSLVRYLNNSGQFAPDLTGSFNFDPLCEKQHLETGDIDFVKATLSALPAFHVITVHATSKEHPNIVDELATTLHKAHQYVVELTDAGLAVEQVTGTLQFYFAITPDYFMQIAKIRAFRQLWKLITHEYLGASSEPFIQAEKSWAHHHQEDPFKNMLLHTTEGMSAAIAGCNVINLRDISSTETLPREFFKRIARNVQHILKYEAKLDKVVDPGAGSWYLEKLTNELADKAWERFKVLEKEAVV